MRRVVLGLLMALLVASVACSAAGSGGSGAPQRPAPSLVPTPTGGPSGDPYYEGY